MAYLAVSDLTFTYHGSSTPALAGCSLSVREGEFLLVVGRSGCGKTTLLRSLKPALAPYGERTGSVALDGVELDRMSPRDAASLIGFVGQDPERQTVSDVVFAEIAFGPESVGIDGALIPGRVAEAMDFLGIGRLASKKIAELSGGEKQLVNLASALALNPRLLLLDEPVTRLDPPAKLRFLSAVRRINEEAGVTVILAGHDVEELFPLVDRVARMDAGRIVSVLPPRDFARPRNRADRRGALRRESRRPAFGKGRLVPLRAERSRRRRQPDLFAFPRRDPFGSRTERGGEDHAHQTAFRHPAPRRGNGSLRRKTGRARDRAGRDRLSAAESRASLRPRQRARGTRRDDRRGSGSGGRDFPRRRPLFA